MSAELEIKVREKSQIKERKLREKEIDLRCLLNFAQSLIDIEENYKQQFKGAC